MRSTDLEPKQVLSQEKPTSLATIAVKELPPNVTQCVTRLDSTQSHRDLITSHSSPKKTLQTLSG